MKVADTWRVVENPSSGETFTFLETAEETGGLRVVARIDLAPGGGVSPHSHGAQERFECPPGDFERIMRALAGLARDGRMVPGRPPRVNPLAMAYLASRDGYYMPPLPRWLYRPLMGGLGALGRTAGERTLDRYDAKPRT